MSDTMTVEIQAKNENKHLILPKPDLTYTPEIAKATAHLYERVARVVTPIEWPTFAPYIKAINDLKRERKRRHSGSQLHDARNFSLYRRFHG